MFRTIFSTGRRPFFLRLLISGFLLVGLTRAVVCAQGPLPPDVAEPGTSKFVSELSPDHKPIRLQQTPLDAVILFNEAGKRSIVLPGGWPPEVLDEFYKFLFQDRREPVPQFTIQEMVARGHVVDNRVEAEIRIVLTTVDDRLVRIPIDLKEGILPFPAEDQTGPEKPTVPYRYSGPGVLELMIDPHDGQYVIQIRPKPRDVKPEVPLSYFPESMNEWSLPEEAYEPLSVPPDDETEFPDDPLRSDPEMSPEPPSEARKESRPADSPERSRELLSSERRHELVLSLWFPLTRLGEEEQRLSVSFPPSISSRFVLTVPVRDAEATTTQGSLLERFDIPERASTRFNILGLKPHFSVSWRKKQTETTEVQPVLYVKDASVIVRMESNSTLYEATLPVRSSVGGFDRLRIRLPRGAVPDRESTEKFASSGGYSLRELSPDERDALASPSDETRDPLPGEASAPILEVLFPSKISGPVDIRIKALQQHVAEKPGSWRDLAGFDVLGAERQEGAVVVGIPAEMRSNWKPVRGVRQTGLSSVLLQEGFNACFEFSSQPFLLQSQIVSPQTRINVKPEYRIQVGKGSLLLNARFTVVIHGPRTENLKLRLFDWQWSGDIGPAGAVDVEGVDQDETGLLSVPLRVVPDGEAFHIDLRAYRTLPPGTNDKQRLIVRMPQPEARWSEPAPVMIIPDDNVEIIPIDFDPETRISGVKDAAANDKADPAKVGESAGPSAQAEPPPGSTEPARMFGLTRRSRRSLPSHIEIPIRQQDPLIYQTDASGAVFVADVLYHRQEITASIQTDVRLLDPEDQVMQTISYDVAYEPIDKLFLRVPKALREHGSLRVLHGGKTLELREVIPSLEDAAPEHGVRMRISFPETLIGKFQLTLRYGIAPVSVEHDLTRPVSIPFVLPEAPVLRDHQTNMIVPVGVRIELQDEASRLWRTLDPVSAPAYDSGRPLSEFRFQSARLQSGISLLVSLADRDVLGTTVIERAWLQTWLTDSIRLDRGTYWATSDRDSISLRLPNEVVNGKIFVRCDRAPVPVRLSDRGELSIPLTAGQREKGNAVLLEIWYQIPFVSRNQVRLELPHFGDNALVRCQYWQLILPRNRHVAGVPAGWTPEYHWSWNGYFWGRTPSLRMEEIGLQTDSADEASVSTEGNQYLFSNLRPPSEIVFYVVDRAVIVLFSSTAALLIGLILIYFPRTRYAGSLLGLVLALIAITTYQPMPVLLMLQASSFGVALALGAGYVYRILCRDEQWIVPPPRSWTEDSRPSEVYSVIIDDESKSADGSGLRKETGSTN